MPRGPLYRNRPLLPAFCSKGRAETPGSSSLVPGATGCQPSDATLLSPGGLSGPSPETTANCSLGANTLNKKLKQAQGPTRAPLEPHQHTTRGLPTGLYSAGTSPEPMEPETSDHRGQNPYLQKGLPGPHELSPAQPAPQDDPRIGTPSVP
ncbi:PREDICTED: putative uncharacterized protein LOC387726-like [Lipotes vexillifer]|uniref:Uncharacterized protein n=1 Tax=Lipotes vexillifer TaxID=118797 RepID=A0A340Y5H6_LIPVE|nr:PREDICTED: putative uncharacterized protein LOC387726-like [Lipotes vexillifer]